MSLALVALLYWAGAGKTALRARDKLAFTSGLLLLCIVLMSPIASLSNALVSAHVLEDAVLLVAAAPLLAVSRTFSAILTALPLLSGWRDVALLRETSRTLTDRFVSWCLVAIALWAWSSPALFQSSARSSFLHAFRDVSILLAAVLFWSSVIHVRLKLFGYSASLLAVITTAIHSMLLGWLLWSSPSIRYPAYSTTTRNLGLNPIEDQQFAGVLQLGLSVLVYSIAIILLATKWHDEPEWELVEAPEDHPTA